MTTKSVLLALMAMWGVGTVGCLPASAEDVAAAADVDEEAEPGLTDRVWVRTGEGDLPGVMQVFLADGTLVSDSCWETYRLSSWSWVEDGKVLQWEEDGMPISAEIRSLSADQLVLVLDVGGGTEQVFEAAQVPSVCPGMPK